MPLTPEAIATLSRVSTATITTVLLKKGLRNVWLRGSRPLRPGVHCHCIVMSKRL